MTGQSFPWHRAGRRAATLALVLVLWPAPAFPLPQVDGEAAHDVGREFLRPFRWRNIGPNRGGRSIAVAGSAQRPLEYYFGATGGGLWKTSDGGVTWRPVTDGQIRSSSVGAVAVAPSAPDVVYLGMGEVQLRGNVMQGDGVYRSTDGGVTWLHRGLDETQAIARIRVHPRDPDLVYIAALGHPYGPNRQRGVYRSEDGGATWEKVLYRGPRAGAVDLTLDPRDPRVIYATLWEVHRNPWMLWSGGAGSGLFKSTDGGDHWTELTGNPGMPSGVLGKITVAVSGADSRRVYANIEAEEGGLYRSDDGGETWSWVNRHRDLWQRSFYFMRIHADPVDRETVYVLNFLLHKSSDGGTTFTEIPVHHADHHDLWIDPTDPRRMINANDGGAAVTVNGGDTWTDQRYPTAQIYRLATTTDIPYHVCGAQQDNTTVCVSRQPEPLRNPGAPAAEWFYAVGGGENAYIAPHPRDPNIFYAGATNSLTRYDRRTGQARDIQPYPRMVMGEPARVMPERWNWVYPIVLSPLDPDVLYVGSQHVWRTNDDGYTWARISPDLTRADPRTLGDTGGPLIKDQDGPEVYATLFTIAPSPLDSSVIWVGSDDGLVHLTQDGGKTWRDVTPPDLPTDTRVSLIDASPHLPEVAYVAAKRYEMEDRSPYLWKTPDRGLTWKRTVQGIREDDFVHVVRADPKTPGLVYAGTEHGIYVSFDDGAQWHSLSLNLPDVHVSGVAAVGRDLVIATHGRSFYVLDDIAPLRQLSGRVLEAPAHLFQPDDAVRRLDPATFYYHLRERADEVKLEVLDHRGEIVRRLEISAGRSPGLHRIQWDLRYPGATVFPGIVLEGSDPSRGVWAPPGLYRIRLSASGVSQTRPFGVLMDPRLVDVSESDLQEQFRLDMTLRDLTSAANDAVVRIRRLRQAIVQRLKAVRDGEIVVVAHRLVGRLAQVESELYQVKNQSPKDKIAFPIKLNNRLSGLLGNLERGDGRPPAAYYGLRDELSAELATQLALLDQIIALDLAQLNQSLVRVGGTPVPADPQ